MKIGVIGSGLVGGILGKLYAEKGHEIMFGSRNPGGNQIREKIDAAGGKALAGTLSETAAFGDVLLLTTPWKGTKEALELSGDLNGKILIDCTNPLSSEFGKLAVGPETSGAEEIAKWAKGARVVKDFSTLGAVHFPDPVFDGLPATMFICGDDSEAKEVVSNLTRELGFDVVDAGPLIAARGIEPMVILWLSMVVKQGTGPVAFRLLRR